MDIRPGAEIGIIYNSDSDRRLKTERLEGTTTTAAAAKGLHKGGCYVLRNGGGSGVFVATNKLFKGILKGQNGNNVLKI